MTEALTILITNDDGVASPGLSALVRAAVGAGRQVVVAAPASDQSGTSAAVAPRPAEGTAVERITIPDLDEPGFDGLIAFSVDGPPALAVLAARLGELGAPAHAASLVASGINLGPNTGAIVLHSGTVGAALAAANLGLSGLAVSIDSMRPAHLETATIIAAAALDWLADSSPGTVLNVNVPDLAVDRLTGIRETPLAAFRATGIVVHEPPPGPFTIQIRGNGAQPEPDTDSALLHAGWVTVTSLRGITAVGRTNVAGHIERAITRAA